MKKQLSALLAAALCAGALAGCGANSNSANAATSGAEDTVTLAVVSPVTGDSAEYGIHFNVGAQMAADKINEAGGINGKQVVLKSFDSKNDAKEAAEVARLICQDKTILATIGDFSSTCCMATAPIYEENKTVQISPSAGLIDFPRVGPYNFSTTGVQENDGGFLMNRVINEKMGAKSVAMDGMALLEEITRRNIDVLIIVLSAYDQFEYAQKAISSRKVFEYVLKPIRRGNFCTLLQKAAAAVRSKRAESSPDSQALYDEVRKNYNGFLMQGHTAEGIALVRQKLEALPEPWSDWEGKKRFLIALYTDTQLEAVKQSTKNGQPACLPMNGLVQFEASHTDAELWQTFVSTVEELQPYLQPATAEASKASAVIEHCLRAIDAHYMERTFSLNWLAEEMKLNPNYLSTRFKKETGVGFVRYVNQLRVWRAQQLLRDMRYRAGEVAGMVGFDNPQYFTRIFKEMTGIVPSEYRSRICPHDDET